MAVELPQLTSECTGLFIDGEWTPSDSTDRISVSTPIDGSELTSVPAGCNADVDAAYEAAAAAQSEWASITPDERAAVLARFAERVDEHEDALVSTLAAESGSVTLKGSAELDIARGFIDFAAALPHELHGTTGPASVPNKENRIEREPAGVVGVISPWNFPFSLTIRAVAPAIALGNTVVIKPSSETPITSGLCIAKLFELAGAPAGVVNVVTGRGSDIGDRMASHPTADVIAFTGSTGVGRRVSKLAAEQLTPQAMELGGNNPHVVLEDADVDMAVDAGVFGTYLHQGQVCISLNRHLVHESIYDEYVRKLTERTETLPIGDPRDAETVIGPIINETERDELLEYVSRTEDAGARVETGGDAEGLYLEPTVLSGVHNDMAAACNEHFGPIAPVIPFGSDEEAIEIANDTEYGLAASVHSGDRRRAESVSRRIEAGMVHINDQPINSNPRIPFGGRKDSGIGQFNGEAIVKKFTDPKWISIQTEPRSYPF
ncbi:aldehyde dehydrogenase family protein [Halopenitus sp. POP-27]|uniref:aldehyde dehydrogenase family protein n=1 Tax=Halopenitus sp. POP-27 TaxID=2994425 RepID=UPI0024697898|nr:aldehyde dehydrogenase family protein [Halopenitus sp. POP-27]